MFFTLCTFEHEQWNPSNQDTYYASDTSTFLYLLDYRDLMIIQAYTYNECTCMAHTCICTLHYSINSYEVVLHIHMQALCMLIWDIMCANTVGKHGQVIMQLEVDSHTWGIIHVVKHSYINLITSDFKKLLCTQEL